MKNVRPKDDQGYRWVFWTWMQEFHRKYLDCENCHFIQKALFHVRPNNFDHSINPDISGSMTQAIIDSSEILCGQKHQQKKYGHQLRDKNNDIAQAIEMIEPNDENCKILFEICKFYGKDINIMEMYNAFKTILKKGGDKFTSDEQKVLFTQALSELKYMGYLSQTRQSSFIFKKNYFGKAKNQKNLTKTEKEMEREKEII